MERDIFIRGMFSNTPLLWELLSFVAIYCPPICYCSVLIRALTATLINQWKSMGEQSKDDDSENYRNLMDTTIKVIDVMALGKLLPPPLSSIRDVLPYLKCFEVSLCDFFPLNVCMYFFVILFKFPMLIYAQFYLFYKICNISFKFLV